MSKTGQASSDSLSAAHDGTVLRARRAERRRRNRRWILRLVLQPLAALPVLAVLAAVGLAIRLAEGPLEVSGLVHLAMPLPLGDRTKEGPRGRLGIGRAWIGWDGFRHGSSGAVTLRLADVTVVRADGTVADRVDDAQARLDGPALLRGVPDVLGIAVRGARLALRRDPETGLGLGLGPPGRAAAEGSSGPAARWNRLARVSVSDLQLSVQDRVVGHDWVLRDVAIEAGPNGQGIVGSLAATMRLSGPSRGTALGSVTLRGVGTPDPTGAELVDWHLTLDPLVPAAISDALPMLAPLGGLALPVASVLDVRFASGPGRFMEPVRVRLAATLGRGTLRVAGTALPVESGLVRVVAALPDGPLGRAAIRLEQADLRLRDARDAAGAPATGPTAFVQGALSIDRIDRARRIRGSLSAEVPAIGFDRLAQFWPAGAASNARRWVLANITAGQATGLHVETGLVGAEGWDSVRETRRSGGFDATGLTLWWLRPMPPLRDMAAHLELDGTNALRITAPHAVLEIANRAGTLAVHDGTMRIEGLEAAHQPATIRVALSGGLSDLLAELSNPRLHLLSAHPVPFTGPAGQIDSEVTVALPLDSHVALEQVRIGSRTVLRHGRLGDVVAGRALEDAELVVAADTNGLAADGTGVLGGIPAALHYAMDFRAGPPGQPVEQGRVRARVDAAVLRRQGLDPGGHVDGSAGLAADYAARRDGRSSVALALDLAGLGIHTAAWSKPRGAAARVSVRIGLLHGHLAAIDALRATGPGLAVAAHAVLEGGAVRAVAVDRLRMGRTEAAGRIELPAAGVPVAGVPAAPVRVEAHGTALDLAPLVDGPSAAAGARTGTATSSGAGTPWIADLRFDRVFVGPRTRLGGVAAHLEDDGRRIDRMRLSASTPTAIRVALVPDPTAARPERRRLDATVADAGALLRGLDVSPAIAGGALALHGTLDDPPGAPPGTSVAGEVSIRRFVLRDAPRAARLARDLSIYGMLDALPSPRLGVDRLVAPFTVRDGVLTLREARAHDAALGVTMNGRIDLARHTLALRGTVVPVWAVNRLPGRIPLLGRLLVPEPGGGLLAATVAIGGDFSAPRVHVNLWSLLAPGVLRPLLFR